MDEYWNDFEEYRTETDNEIDGYITDILDELDRAFEELEDKYHPANIGSSSAKKIYSLVREIKPNTMVETGVCNGVSSSVILKAMEENGKGRLYSIDLPVAAGTVDDRTGPVIPPEKSAGWLVPENFKDRWELRLGNTYYELPKVLQETKAIDMFIHDSGHSYETMMFEFCIVWYHLNEGGLILADNIDWNSAFKDFASAKELQLYKVHKLGMLKK